MNFLTVLLLTALSYFLFRYVIPKVRTWEDNYREAYISPQGAILLTLAVFCILSVRMYYEQTQIQEEHKRAAELGELGRELEHLRQELDSLTIDTDQGRQRFREINERLIRIQEQTRPLK